jgi:3-isopropylmalate/(R)-2-methylmalate dehydratase large subunit
MDLKADTPLTDLKIDAAFIGSCTNSRISDLRKAARILKGNKVAAHVKAICVPGSTAVKAAAEAEGLDQVFRNAGFEWRESGCSMCFFAGGESFGPGERVVTSTNRNFESRQGPKTRSHLASPETVAASALTGRITDPRKYAKGASS